MAGWGVLTVKANGRVGVLTVKANGREGVLTVKANGREGGLTNTLSVTIPWVTLTHA